MARFKNATTIFRHWLAALACVFAFTAAAQDTPSESELITHAEALGLHLQAASSTVTDAERARIWKSSAEIGLQLTDIARRAHLANVAIFRKTGETSKALARIAAISHSLSLVSELTTGYLDTGDIEMRIGAVQTLGLARRLLFAR